MQVVARCNMEGADARQRDVGGSRPAGQDEIAFHVPVAGQRLRPRTGHELNQRGADAVPLLVRAGGEVRRIGGRKALAKRLEGGRRRESVVGVAAVCPVDMVVGGAGGDPPADHQHEGRNQTGNPIIAHTSSCAGCFSNGKPAHARDADDSPSDLKFRTSHFKMKAISLARIEHPDVNFGQSSRPPTPTSGARRAFHRRGGWRWTGSWRRDRRVWPWPGPDRAPRR